MTRGKKAPVALRAVLQRLQRKLKEEEKAIRRPRGRGTGEQNRLFLVDLRRNVVVETGIGPERLEELGRELDCLEEWEEVARD